MIYLIKNGQQVCDKGWIVIETIEHFILGGFVACNNSLNSKSWNTTQALKTCEYCSKYKLGQLKLF